MKFSELWLREWVNPAIDSEALSDQITMAGLEVDGVEPVAACDKSECWRRSPAGHRLRRAKLPSGAKGRGSHHRRRAAGRF